MGNYIGIVGIVVLLGIAYAFSSNRKAINLRVVGAALALQAAIAAFVIYFEAGRNAISNNTMAASKRSITNHRRCCGLALGGVKIAITATTTIVANSATCSDS